MNNVSTVDTYTFTVENVSVPGWARHSSGFYTIELDIRDSYSEDKDTRIKAKAALAALRKRVRKYRGSRDYRHLFLCYHDQKSSTTGSTWTLDESVILHIADQLVTDEPLEKLFQKAINRAKEVEERKAKEAEERRVKEAKEREKEAKEREYIRRITTPFWLQSSGMPVQKAFAIFSFRDRTLFDISSEDVKRQYRVLAKQCHPDAGGDAEKFRTLQTAYETLKELTTLRPA